MLGVSAPPAATPGLDTEASVTTSPITPRPPTTLNAALAAASLNGGPSSAQQQSGTAESVNCEAISDSAAEESGATATAGDNDTACDPTEATAAVGDARGTTGQPTPSQSQSSSTAMATGDHDASTGADLDQTHAEPEPRANAEPEASDGSALLPERAWPAISGPETAAALVPCKLYLQCEGSTLLMALLAPGHNPARELPSQLQDDLVACEKALRDAARQAEAEVDAAPPGDFHYLRYDPNSNGLEGRCGADWAREELRFLPESRESTHFVRAVGTLHDRLVDAQTLVSRTPAVTTRSHQLQDDANAGEAAHGEENGEVGDNEGTMRGAAAAGPRIPASVVPGMARPLPKHAAEAALRRGGVVFNASCFFGVETFFQARDGLLPAPAAGAPRHPFDAAYADSSTVAAKELEATGVLPTLV